MSGWLYTLLIAPAYIAVVIGVLAVFSCNGDDDAL